jgi:hypothetical protein
MTALTARAALVDPAALGDGEGVIATSVPRAEVEEALQTGTTSELFIDVAREREGERDAEHRITVSWEPADLEKLLGSTTGDEVTFAFRPDELARMFDEPDVEAQGLRERMAILTVAATTAARLPRSSPTRPAAGPKRPLRPKRPAAEPACRTAVQLRTRARCRTSSPTRRVAPVRPSKG